MNNRKKTLMIGIFFFVTTGTVLAESENRMVVRLADVCTACNKKLTWKDYISCVGYSFGFYQAKKGMLCSACRKERGKEKEKAFALAYKLCDQYDDQSDRDSVFSYTFKKSDKHLTVEECKDSDCEFCQLFKNSDRYKKKIAQWAGVLHEANIQNNSITYCVHGWTFSFDKLHKKLTAKTPAAMGLAPLKLKVSHDVVDMYPYGRGIVLVSKDGSERMFNIDTKHWQNQKYFIDEHSEIAAAPLESAPVVQMHESQEEFYSSDRQVQECKEYAKKKNKKELSLRRLLFQKQMYGKNIDDME